MAGLDSGGLATDIMERVVEEIIVGTVLATGTDLRDMFDNPKGSAAEKEESKETVRAIVRNLKAEYAVLVGIISDEVVKHIKENLQINLDSMTGASVTAFNMDDVLPGGATVGVTTGGKAIQSGFTIFSIGQETSAMHTVAPGTVNGNVPAADDTGVFDE